MADEQKVRYSDEDLAEFKEIVLAKLEGAREQYASIRERMSNNNNSDVDTAPTYKNMEDGSEALSREELGLKASRLEKFIRGLQGALIRIENKTYGISRVTGKLIPKERLRAVPHATTNVEDKEARR